LSSLIGKVLANRYTIEQEIGRGGMADVYKAWDKDRTSFLALKILRQDLAQDVIFLRRFQREAQTLAKLQHPNIVRFFGIEADDLLVFMLMEYIEGTTLQTEIFRSNGKPLNRDFIYHIMRSVCSALFYAHRQNLIHCDIKPGNIMINRHSNVLLTDFGIARMSDAATATMVGFGTPSYLAPELVRGEDPTPQSDIYSLGVLLFEMVTGGERPFTGQFCETTGSTSEKVRWEQVHLPPPSPRIYQPEIPEVLEKTIMCCLAKHPSDRFATVLDLINSFEQGNTNYQSQYDFGVSSTRTTNQPNFRSGPETNERTVSTKVQKSWTHPAQLVKAPTKEENSRILTILLIIFSVLMVLSVAFIFFNDSGGSEAALVRTGLEGNVFHPTETVATPTIIVEVEETIFNSVVVSDETSIPTFTPTPTPTKSLGIGSYLVRETDGMKMMYVPAGDFWMGSLNNDPDAFANEKPQIVVFVDAFWMDAYEISNAMFAQFVMQTGYRTLAERQGHSYVYDSSWEWTPAEGFNWRNPRGEGSYAEDHLPVVHVSYDDVTAYCGWAGGRLPTEAEWEKAARGDDGLIYPWGNEFDPTFLRHQSQTGPVSVDRFPEGQSPYDIYNMAGNVFEWTSDWYRADYYQISPRNNPIGPTDGEFRVMRGGSWHNSRKNVRTARRDISLPHYMNGLLGFRCVMDVD